jgi:hypothetical protein
MPGSARGRDRSHPRRNQRLRSWAAPTSDARTQHHSASYPRVARSAATTSCPRPRKVIAATFSRKMRRGRTSSMVRARWDQTLDLGPSMMPSPFPASEISVQGKPPVMISTAPRHARPSKVRASLHTGASSRARSAMRETSRATPNASRSMYRTVRASGIASLTARSRPPLPLNMERTRHPPAPLSACTTTLIALPSS